MAARSRCSRRSSPAWPRVSVSSASIICSRCCSEASTRSWAARSEEKLASRVGERDLDQRSLAGQRRAQLVRGVRDELALRLEGSVEPAEQVIEGVPELLEFILRAVERQTFVQTGGGDPRAVRVMVRIGRSILPATSQPAKRASTATIARAIPELTRSWCESAARCAASTDPACAT